MSAAMFVWGYSGLGFGIVSITLISFFAMDIERVSVIISLVTVVFSLLLMLISKEHGHVHWRKVAFLYGGLVIGLPVGYWFIDTFGNRPVFGIILGIILVAYGIVGLRKPHAAKPMGDGVAIPVGMLSGFISGAFVSGGPPLVIYLYSQTDDAREMKATIQAVFMISTFTRLILIAFGEKGYSMDVVWPALISLPLLVPILFVSHAYSKRHSPETFKRVVNILIAVFGCIKLVKAVIQLISSAG